MESVLKLASEALEAFLRISHRLSGCSHRPCVGCDENSAAVAKARKALEALKAGAPVGSD